MHKAQCNMASVAMSAAFAGPLYVMNVAILSWLAHSATAVMMPDSWLFGAALLLLPVSSIFGAFIAVLPCWIGSAIMIVLGRINAGFQLPVMWGLAGAALAAMPLIVNDDYEEPAKFALIATGAVCALICRKGVRWDVLTEPDPTPRTPAICVTAKTDPETYPPLQRKGFLR